jgi:hypothetical protein
VLATPSRRIALTPLDPRVPDAVRRDKSLGELQAPVDAIRIGGARERGLAAKAQKAAEESLTPISSAHGQEKRHTALELKLVQR